MRNSSILLLTYGRFLGLDETKSRSFIDGISFFVQSWGRHPIYEFHWCDGVYSKILSRDYGELKDDIEVFGKEEMIGLGTQLITTLKMNEICLIIKEYMKSVPKSSSLEEWMLMNNTIQYFHQHKEDEFLDVDKLHNINHRMKKISKYKIQETLDRFNVLAIHLG